MRLTYLTVGLAVLALATARPMHAEDEQTPATHMSPAGQTLPH